MEPERDERAREQGRWLVDMMTQPAQPKWVRSANVLGAIAVAAILAGGGILIIARGNVLAGLCVLAGVPTIYVMVKLGR